MFGAQILGAKLATDLRHIRKREFLKILPNARVAFSPPSVSLKRRNVQYRIPRKRRYPSSVPDARKYVNPRRNTLQSFDNDRDPIESI